MNENTQTLSAPEDEEAKVRSIADIIGDMEEDLCSARGFAEALVLMSSSSQNQVFTKEMAAAFCEVATAAVERIDMLDASWNIVFANTRDLHKKFPKPERAEG